MNFLIETIHIVYGLITITIIWFLVFMVVRFTSEKEFKENDEEHVKESKQNL